MKLWNFSGASTKFIYHVSIAEELLKEGLPDFISGVSSGSIVSIPVALNLLDKAKELGLNLKLNDFMEESPVTNKGKLTIKSKFKLLLELLGIKSFKSLGKQNIKPILSSIVTKEIFTNYVNGIAPIVLLTAYNPKTKEKKLWNVKELNYEEYLDVVSASSAIPLATQSIEIDDTKYYDTGVRDHIASQQAIKYIEDNYSKVTEVTSVYARPFEQSIDSNWNKNLKSIVSNMYSTIMFEISKSDETIERLNCKLKSIKLTQYFSPYTFKNLYNVNKKELLQLYNDAKTRTTIKEYDIYTD